MTAHHTSLAETDALTAEEEADIARAIARRRLKTSRNGFYHWERPRKLPSPRKPTKPYVKPVLTKDEARRLRRRKEMARSRKFRGTKELEEPK